MSPSMLDDVDDWVDVQELPTRVKESIDQVNDKAFYISVHKTFTDRLAETASPVCVADVDATKLFDCFLENLPAKHRQAFTCSTCRKFMKKYGHLACVTDNGDLQSLLWDPTAATIDEFFKPAVQALALCVNGKKKAKAFVITQNHESIGHESSGGFHHFHATFPKGRVRTIEGVKDSRIPPFKLVEMLEKIMGKYDIDTVRHTAQILNENKLPYATNHTAAINWLLDILETNKVKGDSIARQNLMFRYAASAFIGCLSQLSNGVLSTLLDNVKANAPWKTIQAQWCNIANPIRYMRPTEPPKAGNIAAAEKLFQELGLTRNDMRRRFLTIDDIPENVVMWSEEGSSIKARGSSGIFANIKSRQVLNKNSITNRDESAPATSISFTRFVNQVLPRARSIDYQLKPSNNIFFLITGLEGTKPLMQWHNDTNRASWYTYPKSSRPHQYYGLKPDSWNKVTHIIPFPHLWDGIPHTITLPLESEKSEKFKYYHKNEGFKYLFALEGGQEMETARNLCLFPTFLKSEFHGVRSTIESYSASMRVEKVVDRDWKGGYVLGVDVSRDRVDKEGRVLRVTDDKGLVSLYKIVLFE